MTNYSKYKKIDAIQRDLQEVLNRFNEEKYDSDDLDAIDLETEILSLKSRIKAVIEECKRKMSNYEGSL